MGIQELSLLLVVTVGGLTDIQTGKIPNWLSAPASLWGLLLAAVGGAGMFGDSLFGLILGFVPFFVLYLMGTMGGGDVKLMAAVGAIMGSSFVVSTMITSIFVGGLLALLIVIWEGKLAAASRFIAATLGRVFYRQLAAGGLETREKVPFGVAICLASYSGLIANWLGYYSPAELLRHLFV